MESFEAFRYDHNTGELYWKIKRSGRRNIDTGLAGTINSCGYKIVELDNKKYLAHRMIWEMLNGSIPKDMCIDHIDGDKLNNRIQNLRLVTLSINQRNSRLPKNNKFGICGITKRRNSKREYFTVSCGAKYIGIFDNFLEACCARKSAELRMNYHENHGRRMS